MNVAYSPPSDLHLCRSEGESSDASLIKGGTWSIDPRAGAPPDPRPRASNPWLSMRGGGGTIIHLYSVKVIFRFLASGHPQRGHRRRSYPSGLVAEGTRMYRPSCWHRPQYSRSGAGSISSRTVARFSPGARCACLALARLSWAREASTAGSRSSVSGSRSEEHTSELQSRFDIVCRLLLVMPIPLCFSLFPYTTLFRSPGCTGLPAGTVRSTRAQVLAASRLGRWPGLVREHGAPALRLPGFPGHGKRARLDPGPQSRA